MIKALAIAITAAGFLSSPSVAGEAGTHVGVVELFTSQGCNSCPPADAYLRDLANQDDVIALSYHVDYWDYLGWKDTLGSAEYTQRQYGYAASFGTRTVYTPQAVVNGRMHVNGADRRKVANALSDMTKAGNGLFVPLSVKKRDGTVVITAQGSNASSDAHLVLVSYAAATPIKIDRGENRGKTIIYANAVTRIRTVGMWHGGAERYEIPESEIMKGASGGCAVLLQEYSKKGEPGAIIGATIIRPHGS